jgi:mono/diheme cytochrome c family protein
VPRAPLHTLLLAVAPAVVGTFGLPTITGVAHASEQAAPAKAASQQSVSGSPAPGSTQDALGPQAALGKGLFAAKCASCHGPNLEGGRLAPPLSGPGFQANWDGKPARALYSRIISTMPLSDPGSLPPAEVLNIALYVFAVNGAALGTQPTPDAASLNNIKVDMGHKGS